MLLCRSLGQRKQKRDVIIKSNEGDFVPQANCAIRLSKVDALFIKMHGNIISSQARFPDKSKRQPGRWIYLRDAPMSRFLDSFPPSESVVLKFLMLYANLA
jgi:hypothetical protein